MINFGKIAVGDKFSRHSYGEVTAVDTITVNQGGVPTKVDVIRVKAGKNEWDVDYGAVGQEFKFHRQFTKSDKVTKTTAAEKFLASPRVVMTVKYRKQLDTAKATKSILALHGKFMSEADYKRAVKAAMKGEERIIVGYHEGKQDPKSGRVLFTDLESKTGSPIRYVDPRTIEYVIVDGEKLEVK